MPILSIITVNLNNAKGLQKTIGSVLSQTFKDFEFIIIDGGSTDGSKEIIESYKDKITYGISEKDSGIFNAMNKGIKASSGAYLIFLNSGDCLYDDNVLHEIFSDIELDSPEIIYGDTLLVYSNGKTIRKNAVGRLTFEYLMEDDICHQSCFIRRELFDKNGFYDEKLRIAGDHKFLLTALILNNASYTYHSLLISRYDMTGISSADIKLCYNERYQVQKEILPELIYDLYCRYVKINDRKDNKLWNRIKLKIRKLFASDGRN